MRVVRAAVAVAVAAAMVVIPAGSAGAAVGLSTSMTLPPSVTVGQTGLAGSFTFTNTNTAPNHGEANNLVQLRLAPSCGIASTSGDLCGAPNPAVFSIISPATGREGTACAGRSFAVSTPDAIGAVVFTPQGGGVVVPPPGGVSGTNQCTVDYTFSVVRSLLFDAAPATPGTQTRATLKVTVQGSVSGLVVSARPTLLVTVVVGRRCVPDRWRRCARRFSPP